MKAAMKKTSPLGGSRVESDALLGEPASMNISVTAGRKRRETVIHVGSEYRVDPLNPAKLRNRARICRVLDFVPVSESHSQSIVAKVRYLDNNRVGRAELSDLVPIDEKE
jgi:hypothetical protein